MRVLRLCRSVLFKMLLRRWLDSVFLQLPVLKKHILCNKVNTVKGRELQELQVIYLMMYLFVSLDQNGLKNPNKQKRNQHRNQNVVSGISTVFDSVDTLLTH